MALTYDSISTTTASGSVSSVTFSSIPSTYTDLVIVSNIGIVSSDTLIIQLNGDTGANYTRTYLSANGTAANSGKTISETWINLSNQDTPTTNAGGYIQIANFLNYANSNIYKTVIGRSGAATSGTTEAAGLWKNTNAITSITMRTVSQNFTSGSTFTLFGVKAA